jgi:hypothetical protein
MEDVLEFDTITQEQCNGEPCFKRSIRVNPSDRNKKALSLDHAKKFIQLITEEEKGYVPPIERKDLSTRTGNAVKYVLDLQSPPANALLSLSTVLQEWIRAPNVDRTVFRIYPDELIIWIQLVSTETIQLTFRFSQTLSDIVYHYLFERL